MTWLAKVRFHLRTLFAKRKLDEQLNEEVRTHVEMATEANLSKGMPPDEARYAALREFGNVAGVQERARDERGWVWLEQGWQDVRFGFRQLGRTPGFTAVVILTLALGIGGTTALFSMVDTVILNPVGGPEAERMVQVGQRSIVLGKEMFQPVSPPVFDALLARRDEFEDLAWSWPVRLERVTEDFVNIEFGSGVSWNFFSALQCPPLLGRGFASDEAVLLDQGTPDRDTTIVLSHAWWQAQWGGKPDIIGRNIEMSGRHFTVVGVMPPHFQFPDRQALYWIPVEREVLRPGVFWAPRTNVFGRMKTGTNGMQVQAALDTLSSQLMQDHPVTDGYGAMWRMNGQGLRVSHRPLSAALQDGVNWAELRQTLIGLFVAICFVLLIVCANVANLALARLERRQHELSVRAALGAGRGRLVRQLLTENLMLALMGGIAGLAVAAWSLKLLVTLNVMPRLRPVEIDGRLLAVTLILSGVSALVFGLAPMWRGAKVKVHALLADGGLNATGGKKGGYFRNALVVVQVAVTVVLLMGAGLMLLSVARVLRVDPGFDAENLLMVEAELPWGKYDQAKGHEGQRLKEVFIARMHERLSTLPGVSAVGVQQRSLSQVFEFVGRKDIAVAEHANVGTEAHSVFPALRVPLLAGRHLVAGDAERPELVVINETAARRFWPGEYAVGKKLNAPGRPAIEVIGVVGDAKLQGFLTDAMPILYHPFRATWTEARVLGMGIQFVIRTTGEPTALISFVRRELKEAEPALRTPVFKVAKDVLFDSTLAQRTYRNYLGLFALLGLTLSALGVYGVLAFSVTRRTREIGIRMAIGASASKVRGMVLRQGGRLIAIGIAAGLAASLGLTRLLQSQLYEVSPTDPLAMLGAVFVLGIIGLIASWLPARRAARVDPVIALRAE